MFKNLKIILTILIIGIFCTINFVFARAGGGGSSSGGDGGGNIILVLLALPFILVSMHLRNKHLEKIKRKIAIATLQDKAWDIEFLNKRVRDVFKRFQADWSNFNIENMKEYLSEEYYKRMILELSVLQNLQRKNIMSHVDILWVEMMSMQDHVDNNQDGFTAEIRAGADDVLFDVKNNKKLYHDHRPFTEYWSFIRAGDNWKLSRIHQATAEPSLKVRKIIDFAKRNNFYYDADFGWLMMPVRGVIFNGTSFKFSDVNNHVIGYFRNKIIEFYTYCPWAKDSFRSKHYLVAQAILPISYNDILVKRKRLFFNHSPKGLNRIFLESNDFNKKFCLWADPQDNVSSLELLTPNFMEKIYDLPFELNIEIVDNVLYFYTKDYKKVNYEQMLEVLSWAFDEMKM